MNRERIGQAVFLGATALALALYALTAPEGLPWNASVRLAADVHSPWGFYVRVFGGAVALSCCLAALGAGLLASIVNRYFGWRFAGLVALVWTFLPSVWNRAITGERSVCLAALSVGAVWALNVVALWVTRKARANAKDVVAVAVADRLGRVNRIAGWVALALAGVFAVVSASFHDYRLGEAASVFARGVVEAAGDRVIVMNGVLDEQVAREVEKRGGGGQRNGVALVSLREEEANRATLVAWAKREWPIETNLWVAAQVGVPSFVNGTAKAHPERFYLMNGTSTTLESWERRWESFKPYLNSHDPFVPTGRRLFGYEGNAVANALQDNAWSLYKRVYEEIDPGNFSALVNMSEMMRRGHIASAQDRKAVQNGLDAFFQDARKSRHAREIARLSGPIRTDQELMAKLAAEAKKRIAGRIAAGEQLEVPPEILTLVEWSNEMVTLADRGDLVEAGRLARKILSNPKWQGHLSANAVLGLALAKEGDYLASVAFFQTAAGETNRVPAVVLNDYADTLMQLGRLDEAESQARRAVAMTDESYWLARLTLAEILEKKVGHLVRAEVIENGEVVERYVKIEGADKIEAEIRALLRVVRQCAPPAIVTRVTQEYRRFMQ